MPATDNLTPRFNESFWGQDFNKGYEVLMDRMKAASKSEHDMIEFVQSIQMLNQYQCSHKVRAELEEEYSKKLTKISKNAGLAQLIKQELDDTQGHGVSTLCNALESFKNEMEIHAKNKLTLAEDLKVKCIKPLEAFNNQQRESRKEHQNAVEKSLKAKNNQHQIVAKSKEKYKQKATEFEILQRSKADSKDPKVQKAQSALKSAEQEYQTACDKMRDIHTSWIKEFYAACEEFQRLEEMRIDFLRSLLWGYANTFSQGCVNDVSSFERMRQVLEKCNIENDIQLFIKSKGTGNMIPTAPDFNQYGQQAQEKAQTQASNLAASQNNLKKFELSTNSERKDIVVGSVIENSPQLFSASAVNGLSKQSSFNPFHQESVNSSPFGNDIQSFAAKNELQKRSSVNASSIAQNPGFNPFMEPQVQSPSKSFNPFESDNVPNPTAPVMTPTSANGAKILNVLDRSKVNGAPWKAKVLYNYDAANPDELTLDAGQLVNVLGSPEDQWLYGELQIGKVSSYGMFPANIVERI